MGDRRAKCGARGLGKGLAARTSQAIRPHACIFKISKVPKSFVYLQNCISLQPKHENDQDVTPGKMWGRGLKKCDDDRDRATAKR